MVAAIPRGVLMLVGGAITDRPPTTHHRSPPGRYPTDRSPSANALTDNFLGAFGTTNKTQMTASTDNLLGVFGLTDNAEERV